MLDIAIIGGGLCGLTLARRLKAEGVNVVLFEARDRLGGRVLSVPGGAGGSADLGPSWFWPETQPLVTALIAGLGLGSFPQHDEGVVLHLREADKKPEEAGISPVHGGAQRVVGGMGALVTALAKDLGEDSLRLGHVLMGLADRGDHVSLKLGFDDKSLEVTARQVVLAVPPRLLAEQVRFEPALDEALMETLRNTQTWMASRAKVVIFYGRGTWREAGYAGNAFATHEQAVIGEIFDACDAEGLNPALGGFLAFPPQSRETFGVGLPLLMNSQMAQLFGPELEDGEQHYRDWAKEPFTCSTRDIENPATEHVGFANPLLRRAQWDGKLYLGSSETAAQGAGYLEGAIEAARRIERLILQGRAKSDERTTSSADAVSVNTASLGRFRAWVAEQTERAFDDYRHRLNRSLALQRREQLTQRAVLEAIEQVYGLALQRLDDLPFDMRGVPVERGRSALMPEVQAPFRGLMQALMDDVIAFNRTSCALSNFPDEHHPSKDYIQTILRDIAAAWQEFSLSANALLLAKGRRTEQVR